MFLTSNAERYSSSYIVSPLSLPQPELSPIESPVKVLEAEVQVLKKKLSTSQTRNEALETMCQQYKAQVEQKTVEADRAMKRNQTLLAVCEELNSFLKKELGALELQNYLFEVRRLKSELDNKEKDVVSLSAQNSKLGSTIENLSKENSTIRNLSTTLESTITELTARIEMSENMCKEITEQRDYSLTAHENETEQNKGLLDECEQLYWSLKEKENSEAQQLQKHQNEVTRLKVDLEEKDKQLATLSSEKFPKENMEIRSALTTLERIRTVIVRGMSTVRALKTRNGFVETMCQQLKTKLYQKTFEAAQPLQNHQEEVEKLKSELKRKDKQVENSMQEVVDAYNRVTSLESEIESLKKHKTNQQQVSTKKRKTIEETEPSTPKRSRNKNIDSSNSALNHKVKEFKIKWKTGPKYGCEEQNKEIVNIYETCTKMGMNCRESAQIKQKLAKFLGIQKVSLYNRLKLHKKKMEKRLKTQNKKKKKVASTDPPFVTTLANSPISNAQTSPQESNTVAQHFPPLPLMDEDDIKREDIFNSPDQQVPYMEENGQLFQSTSFDSSI